MANLQDLVYKPYEHGRLEEALSLLRAVVAEGLLANTPDLAALFAQRLTGSDTLQRAGENVGVLEDYQILTSERMVQDHSAFDVIHAVPEETPAAVRKHLFSHAPKQGEVHAQLLSVFAVCLYAAEYEQLQMQGEGRDYQSWAHDSLPRLSSADHGHVWSSGRSDAVYLGFIEQEGLELKLRPYGDHFLLLWKALPKWAVGSTRMFQVADLQSMAALQQVQAGTAEPPASPEPQPPASHDGGHWPAPERSVSPLLTPPRSEGKGSGVVPVLTPEVTSEPAPEVESSPSDQSTQVQPPSSPEQISPGSPAVSPPQWPDSAHATFESPPVTSPPQPTGKLDSPQDAPPVAQTPAPPAAPTPPAQSTPVAPVPPLPAAPVPPAAPTPPVQSTPAAPVPPLPAAPAPPAAATAPANRPAVESQSAQPQAGRMQQTSAQPSAGVAGREVDSNDTRAVLKERIRREMRGQQGTAKVSPETPAGPKKEEQPAPPPEKGLKGFLLRSSSILGLLFILCGALPVILITALAESEDAAGAEITYHCENCRQDSPLSAASRQDFRCGACNNRLKRQINPPSGEGVFVLYLYEVWALLLLIHLSRKDGAVLIYAFLLLAALFLHVQWMMQGQIGGDPLVLDVEESVGPRSLSRFLTHVSTLLWVYCIAVLGQRMMRYPLGAILLGVLIGAQAVELYGAWTHTQTLYSLQGVGFWAGVALFPLIVLESVSRNPAEYGDTREPGLVTRMMTGQSGN